MLFTFKTIPNIMRHRIVGIIAAIGAMTVGFERAHKATENLNYQITKFKKPDAPRKSKHNKHAVSNFKSKLKVKPNSVRKDFNSRRR